MTRFVTRHCDDVLVPRDRFARKRMPHRALRGFRRLVPGLPERGVRADGVSSRRATTIDRTEAMRARLLLAVIVFPGFTLTAQNPTGAAPSGAGTTARAGSARLNRAHARSASIDDGWFDTAPANGSRVGILERLRSAVSLGVLDAEAGTAEDMSLLVGGFSPYPMPWGIARVVYAEPGEKVYFARRPIERPDTPPAARPTVSTGSACWWLWVFTGTPLCW